MVRYRWGLIFALSLLPAVAFAQQFSPQYTHTDRSGTITLGGTQQTLMAANSQRRGCVVQNLSTGDLWISELTTAVASQPSIKVPAGAEYTCSVNGIPTGALSIIGATTSQAFAAREW